MIVISDNHIFLTALPLMKVKDRILISLAFFVPI